MENEAFYIVKNHPLKPGEDWNLLRSEGIRHIEKLGHRLWTDYNIHDPGITILEVLCYAITDLSYRAGMPVQDILAEKTEPGADIQNFFTAREILTCHPVTVNDYRRLLIDIEGIRNAWLRLLTDPEPPFYANCKKSLLQYDWEIKNLRPIKPQGLYQVILELDENARFEDLNDWSFESEVNNTALVVNLPRWDWYQEHNIAPGDVDSYQATYLNFNRSAQLHNFEFSLTVGSKTYALAASYAWEGSNTPANATALINHINDTGPNSIVALYLQKLEKALALAQKALAVLHDHRNLCEDFYRVSALEVEEVVVCADLVVEAGADIEEVMAAVLFELSQFIAPPVNFYSIEELMEKGFSSDQIFNGPALDHGFITEAELEGAALKSNIHISDLIQIIMDVPGVVAVKFIQLSNLYEGVPLSPGEEWCLPITPGRAPRLSIERSLDKIKFFKGLIPYRAKKVEALRLLRNKQLGLRTQKLGMDEWNLPIPPGQDQRLSDYHSIQNHFPLTYGVGKKGIPGVVDGLRRAQAKQLKGYLLLFDQFLANYFAQLGHLKDLFSLSEKVDRSYFSQLLYRLPEAIASTTDLDSVSDPVPEIFKLIESFVSSLPAGTDIDKYAQYQADWETFKTNLGNDYVTQLEEITESEEDFYSRRNRFLDHLLARFGESFSDYVLLMYELEGKKAPAELLMDKLAFLQEYPVLSAERFRAFNYTLEGEVWNTDNVSGYEKRLARLTGIENYFRRRLHCKTDGAIFELYEDVAGEYRFRVRGQNNKILLRSEGYTSKQGRQIGINSVMHNGVSLHNYHFKTSSDGKYYYNLLAKNGEIIGTSILTNPPQQRQALVQELIGLLSEECNTEGMHLVEHLLLRPYTDQYPLMPVCIEEGCKSCLGEIDPYSFRMTLVLPAWPARFQNMDFRRFFEYSARLEAPAHLHVKICWVDNEAMLLFEQAFEKWLNALARPVRDHAELAVAASQLITAMNEIRSVYPVATLHDCDESENENPVVLGNTILGSTKT